VAGLCLVRRSILVHRSVCDSNQESVPGLTYDDVCIQGSFECLAEKSCRFLFNSFVHSFGSSSAQICCVVVVVVVEMYDAVVVGRWR
jgi:hypothetical protein